MKFQQFVFIKNVSKENARNIAMILANHFFEIGKIYITYGGSPKSGYEVCVYVNKVR